MNEENISSSLEDYIKTIYYLSNLNEEVRVTDIANELNVTKASVNQAVKKLLEKGYITHQSYGPLLITMKGKVMARNIIKNHDIIKDFLVEVLKVDRKIAEKDACNMEHNISNDTLDKLINYMKGDLKSNGYRGG